MGGRHPRACLRVEYVGDAGPGVAAVLLLRGLLLAVPLLVCVTVLRVAAQDCVPPPRESTRSGLTEGPVPGEG